LFDFARAVPPTDNRNGVQQIFRGRIYGLTWHRVCLSGAVA
jgi:hypothetical protein